MPIQSAEQSLSNIQQELERQQARQREIFLSSNKEIVSDFELSLALILKRIEEEVKALNFRFPCTFKMSGSLSSSVQTQLADKLKTIGLSFTSKRIRNEDRLKQLGSPLYVSYYTEFVVCKN